MSVSGQNITIDEQLFPTTARCRFKQYTVHCEQARYIWHKVLAYADVDSKYVVNGFPYLGKDETRPASQSLGESVVLRLMEPFKGKGRNVTTDNFFTSLKLSDELKKKDTSLVGTVNRIRREVPVSAAETNSELPSTKVFNHGDTTLTAYRCKRNKNVSVLSNMHLSITIGSSDKKKPEVKSSKTFIQGAKIAVDSHNGTRRQ